MLGLTAVVIAWFGWQQFAHPISSEVALPATDAEQSVALSDAGSGARELLPPDAGDMGGGPRTPVERLSQAPEIGESDGSADSSESPADRIAAFSAENETEPFASEDIEVPVAEDDGFSGDDAAFDDRRRI
jgi:hypothetical protein